MISNATELLFKIGMADDVALFAHLFSPGALKEAFDTKFASTSSKGTDRLNGFQFSKTAATDLAVVSGKCLAGTFRFTPYLEALKTKGRSKAPRLISIPTVRDRIVFHQLNKFLGLVFPDCVPRNIAGTYVREISTDLRTKVAAETWVAGADIKTFYDSIKQKKLIQLIETRVKCWQAARLIARALLTPTVPKNARRKTHHTFRPDVGVPQGLAISNILAAIYLADVDQVMRKQGVTYYRYVDDVLLYGEQGAVQTALKSLRARLAHRGLSLHPASSGKSHFAELAQPFGYLGYVFRWPTITVRETTIEKFLQSIAAKFSDYAHNKTRRLERTKYLTPERLAEIFLMELNERITGAISEKKRYGWIAYFNQITELALLHRLDRVIKGMFVRVPDFAHAAPPDLKKLSRAFFEMKFNPSGGYVRNYDLIVTRSEKLEFLVQRGRVGPGDALTDEQINERFDKYRLRVLSEMHADEGVLYG